MEDLRHTISSTTDDHLMTGERFFPESEPSQAMTNDEVAITNLPSTNADSTITRKCAQRTMAGSAGDVTDMSQQNVPNKRRDLSNLMLRTKASEVGQIDL